MENTAQRNSASAPGSRLPPTASQVWQRLAWVFLFACAMGVLEGICVVYLRRLIVAADADHPAAPLARFPIEYVREACTLIMLLAVAWIAGFNGRSRAAHFFFMFGAWDITYYGGLKWFADWPSSLLEWDCLFLIPKPWYGPVLAPVLISGYFMLACCLVLAGETSKASVRVRLSLWPGLLQLLAFAAWYWSFVKDSDRIAVQGYSGVNYSWLFFACGLMSGVLGLWIAARQQRVVPTDCLERR